MTNSIAQKFNVFSLLKFAFPTMVMMVFMSLYTIVDGIFVSRLVGSNALSAVNIVYPVINLMFACGIMLSTGGSAIVARQIGEKKESEARENFSLIALVSILRIGLLRSPPFRLRLHIKKQPSRRRAVFYFIITRGGQPVWGRRNGGWCLRNGRCRFCSGGPG